MTAPMIAILVAVMLLLMPAHDHAALASATVDAYSHDAAENGPLLRGNASRSLALLLAIEFRESGFRATATGDCPGMVPGSPACDAEHARSFCAFQLTGERYRTTLADAGACVRYGLAAIRWSFATCRAAPPEERLAAYARGSCDSTEGRRMSRDRFALAKKIDVMIHNQKGTP